MLYIFVYIIVLFVSYSLFKVASGDMSLLRPNMLSLTYYGWLVGMCFTGPLLSLLGVENYALRLASEESIEKAFFFTAYAMIAMPISMITCQKLLFNSSIKRKIKSFYESKITPLQSPKDSAQIIYWSLITAICLFGVLYVYSIITRTPIIHLLLGGSPLEAARIRNTATFNYPGNVYVRNLIVMQILPLSSFVAYGYYKLYQKKSFKLWALILFILGMLAVTYTGEKKPIVVYVLSFVIINSIIKGGFSKKNILLFIIVFISIIYFLYYISDGIVLSLYGGPLSRLIMVPSAGLAFTFDLFPQNIDFLYGASFPGWMIEPFGLEHQRSSRLVMEAFDPTGGVEAGTAGVINSLFIAEAWANFGFAGALISPFIVGFVLQSLYNYILSLGKTPVSIGLFTYFMFESYTVLGGFVDFLWNVGWIVILSTCIIGVKYRYGTNTKI